MRRLSERECEQCGGVFSPKRREQKFCSLACYWLSPQMGRMSRSARRRRCDECGEDFVGIRQTQVFCSPECRRKHHNKVRFTCPTCGVTRLVWRHKQRRHCSRECRWGASIKKLSSGAEKRLTPVRPRKKNCLHAFVCGPTEVIHKPDESATYSVTEGTCQKCGGFARFVMREDQKTAPAIYPTRDQMLNERAPLNEIPHYV